MPFFQVDDQLPVNKKTKSLVEATALAQEPEGLQALGLWVLAGAATQASLTDGQVTLPDLIRLLLDRNLAERLAARLVDAGFWHTTGHTCPRCRPAPPGTWLFHDWADLGYGAGAQIRAKRATAKELKDAALRRAVWQRDAIDPANPVTGLCRYCGTLVKQQTTRGPQRADLDHVVPGVAIGLANLVLCCKACNQAKAQRAPAAAGLTLRPAPRDDGLPDPLRDNAAALAADSTPRTSVSALMHSGRARPALPECNTRDTETAADALREADAPHPSRAVDGLGLAPTACEAETLAGSTGQAVPTAPSSPAVHADGGGCSPTATDGSGLAPTACEAVTLAGSTGQPNSVAAAPSTSPVVRPPRRRLLRTRPRTRDGPSPVSAGQTTVTVELSSRGAGSGKGLTNPGRVPAGSGRASSGPPAGCPPVGCPPTEPTAELAGAESGGAGSDGVSAARWRPDPDPLVELPAGRFGSPWAGSARGLEPRPVGMCPDHGLDQPCRGCLDGAEL
ncbi:MAG: HNH endonuclease [Bifidobacteriaceae bacterium]|jgi:hypothetical protein|nr:HNH endonuclease [Bifidobacteriaceae bacterium]